MAFESPHEETQIEFLRHQLPSGGERRASAIAQAEIERDSVCWHAGGGLWRQSLLNLVVMLLGRLGKH